MVIRKVGALSLGKMMGILYTVFGLLIGIVIATASLFGLIARVGNPGDASPLALLFGMGAIIIIPVFYGVLGFVFGVIGALLYNVVAAVAGGIELTVDPGGPGGAA